jgi:tRNA threonylcarbamoyladenosine biosynthesis protein TsaB
MSNILLLDTTTHNCSVGLMEVHQGLRLAINEAGTGYIHAEQLHVFIDQILRESGCNPHDLSAVAMSSGPGSYTGLRIGAATAKGLCYALGLPLIAVRTSDVLAAMAPPEGLPDFIISLLDARRMDAYMTVYDGEGHLIHDTAFVTISEALIESLDGKKVVFIGDAASKAASIKFVNGHQFIQEYPAVSGMVAHAQRKFAARDFEDVAYFEPFYLKAFEAGKKKAGAT